MPAVKLCNQSSTNNSKPEYVMAHSMQMLALLVEGFGNKITAILIGARIHEGLKWSNRDHRTLLDTMNAMFFDMVEKSAAGNASDASVSIFNNGTFIFPVNSQ